MIAEEPKGQILRSCPMLNTKRGADMISVFIKILLILAVSPAIGGGLDPIPSRGLRPDSQVQIQTPMSGSTQVRDKNGRLIGIKDRHGVIRDSSGRYVGQESK